MLWSYLRWLFDTPVALTLPAIAATVPRGPHERLKHLVDVRTRGVTEESASFLPTFDEATTGLPWRRLVVGGVLCGRRSAG